MDLDDQLAALAAGELDAVEARALEARVASEPALARRLARIAAVDELLAAWTAEPIPDEVSSRLDARMAAALAELPDAPLRDVHIPTAVPLSAAVAPLRDREETDGRGTGASTGAVDLAAERTRRRGPQRWLAGVGAAAAAVVVIAGGAGVLSSTDEPDPTIMADADQAGDDEAAGDTAAGMAPADSLDDGSINELGVQEDGFTSGLDAGPAVATELELAGGDLASLADLQVVQQVLALPVYSAQPSSDSATNDSTAGAPQADDQASRSASTAELALQTDEDRARFGRLRLCVDAAQEDAPDATVALVGTGTYESADAIIVVLVSPPDGDGGRLVDVRAYDAGSCVLLDQRTTTR